MKTILLPEKNLNQLKDCMTNECCVICLHLQMNLFALDVPFCVMKLLTFTLNVTRILSRSLVCKPNGEMGFNDNIVWFTNFTNISSTLALG